MQLPSVIALPGAENRLEAVLAGPESAKIRRRTGRRSVPGAWLAFVTLTGLWCLSAPTPAQAELPLALSGPLRIGTAPATPRPRFAAGDTVEIVARRFRPLSPQWTLPLPSHWTSPASAPPLHRSYAYRTATRPRLYERPRAIRALYGADRVAGTAAAVGGLGMVGGLWGEKTAGYLMGAGAVLGALWGGTLGADNPGLRIGVAPERFDPESGRRSERIVVKER